MDDDGSFRSFVRDFLERAGFIVREAADGEHAVAGARASVPSLVVLDVCLPGIGGYEVLRQLQETVDPELPVVFVSGERTMTSDRVSGLLLGADDYIVKPFEPDELLARIRRSLARFRNAGHAAPVALSSRLSSLTARELEVLELLAHGLTQAEIARRLTVSARTIGTHIQHILTKLSVHSRAQAVALALRDGIENRPSPVHVR